MLDPALLNYTPPNRCDPKTGDRLHQDRMRERRRHIRRAKLRQRLARLVCPQCADTFKIHLQDQWFCRHCLVAMVDPKSDVSGVGGGHGHPQNYHYLLQGF